MIRLRSRRRQTEPPAETQTDAPAETTVATTVAAPVDTTSDTTAPSTSVAVEEAPTTTANPNQINQDQVTEITGTVVANGNTGGNVINNQQPAQGGSTSGANVDTGDATAVGSEDENTITQQAQVTLEDQAVANLLQIALILNIGAALAQTGFNSIDAGAAANGAGGAIGTGNAGATGLDIDQYITQAARETADQDTDAHATQLALSLWMGLAQANSGLNAVTGTGVAGSGGAVGSGDATATGNDSLTEIDQFATLAGQDSATLNVTQRATVLNLGFALANSGLNDISGVAGGLLSASDEDDDAMAEEFFAMLLPAFLQSYGYGPGSGSIASGDATATGNESQTFVKQVAAAAASGDGIADIVQDVLVANMGAASANTGGNSLGSVRRLDPETARVVVTMAAFLAQLLSMVHNSTSSTALAAQEQGIEIPFGNLLLRLDGKFDALDTQVAQGGAQANIRQISIIVSLGIANADSGHNSTRSLTQQQNEVNSLISGDPNLIDTGDADAGNETLVIICQRINADDVECLAPPEEVPETPPTTPTTPTTVPATTTPTTAAPTVGEASGTSGSAPPADPGATPGQPAPPQGFSAPVRTPRATPLPSTGSDVQALLVGASGLLILGAFLLLVRRRREPC